MFKFSNKNLDKFHEHVFNMLSLLTLLEVMPEYALDWVEQMSVCLASIAITMAFYTMQKTS